MAHLRIPGNSGDAFVLPYHSSMDETTFLDVRVDVSVDNWASGGSTLVARDEFGGGRSWYFNRIATSLRFGWYQSDNLEQLQSASGMTASAGQRLQARVVANASVPSMTFYWRPYTGLALPDGSGWTSIAPSTSPTHTAIDTDPAQLSVGARGAGALSDPTTGNFYGVYIIKSGSAKMNDVDFTDPTTWVYS